MIRHPNDLQREPSYPTDRQIDAESMLRVHTHHAPLKAQRFATIDTKRTLKGIQPPDDPPGARRERKWTPKAPSKETHKTRDGVIDAMPKPLGPGPHVSGDCWVEGPSGQHHQPIFLLGVCRSPGSFAKTRIVDEVFPWRILGAFSA